MGLKSRNEEKHQKKHLGEGECMDEKKPTSEGGAPSAAPACPLPFILMVLPAF